METNNNPQEKETTEIDIDYITQLLEQRLIEFVPELKNHPPACGYKKSVPMV